MQWDFLGVGNIPNEVNGNFSCLNTGERNSLWFNIQIIESGLLGFNIIPNANEIDFDWAVFNLTNHQCLDIYSDPNLEVSCNFSGSTFPTSTTGANGGTNTYEPDYPFYPQERPMIPVIAGETYYLIVSCFQNINIEITVDFSIGTCEIGECSKLSGSLYLDENDNCIKDQNEIGVANIPLSLSSQEINYISKTDSVGSYTFNFSNGGDMQLEILPFSPSFSMSCEDTPYVLNIPQVVGSYEAPDIAINLTNDVSLNNEINKISFEVYPNPTIDFATVRLDNKIQFANLSIFDLSGKLVMQQNKVQSGYKFSLESFSEGIYFIQLDDEKGWVRHKSLVKIR